MRRLFALLVALAPVAATACAESIPEKVALKPESEKIEVLSDKPNPDLYAPLGEVTGLASNVDRDVALEQAKNDLRNNALARGGSAVTVDHVDSKLEMGTRKTVVKLSGTAYKPKE